MAVLRGPDGRYTTQAKLDALRRQALENRWAQENASAVVSARSQQAARQSIKELDPYVSKLISPKTKIPGYNIQSALNRQISSTGPLITGLPEAMSFNRRKEDALWLSNFMQDTAEGMKIINKGMTSQYTPDIESLQKGISPAFGGTSGRRNTKQYIRLNNLNSPMVGNQDIRFNSDVTAAGRVGRRLDLIDASLTSRQQGFINTATKYGNWINARRGEIPLTPGQMGTLSDPWKMTDHRVIGQADWGNGNTSLNELEFQKRKVSLGTRRRIDYNVDGINSDLEGRLRELEEFRNAATARSWRTGVNWDQDFTAENLNKAPIPGEHSQYMNHTLGSGIGSIAPPLVPLQMDIGDLWKRKVGAGKWASAKYQRMYGTLENDSIFSQVGHMMGLNHIPWASDRKLKEAIIGQRGVYGRKTLPGELGAGSRRYVNANIAGERHLLREQLKKRAHNRRAYAGVGNGIGWQSLWDETFNMAAKVGGAGLGIGFAATAGAAVGSYFSDPIHGAMAGVAIGGALYGVRAYGKMSRENYAHAAGRAKAAELEMKFTQHMADHPEKFIKEKVFDNRAKSTVARIEKAHQDAWASHWYSKLNNSPVVAAKYLGKKTFSGIGSRALMVGELAGGMGGAVASVAMLGAGAMRGAYHGGLIAEYVARTALTGGRDGVNPNIKKAWFPFTDLPKDDARRIGLNPRVASRVIGVAALAGLGSFAREMFTQGAKAPTAHFDGLYMHHMNDMGANGAYAQNILGDAGSSGIGMTGIRAGAIMVDDAALMAARVLMSGRI